jgi:hypothetical protein
MVWGLFSRAWREKKSTVKGYDEDISVEGTVLLIMTMMDHGRVPCYQQVFSLYCLYGMRTRRIYHTQIVFRLDSIIEWIQRALKMVYLTWL